MENRIKVLVLMSTYNGEKYLKDQLDSILNQKVTDNICVDILIRDDGSTDSTTQIIIQYAKLYEYRIKYILGENIGYIKSFFTLIQYADGYDYYALSDQDDIWMDNKILTALQWMKYENNDIPLLYGCTSYLIKNDLIPYGTTQTMKHSIDFFNTIIQNYFPGHNQIMNQLLLNELKRKIDCSKIYVHDSWILNVAVVCGKAIFNNSPHTLYRQHDNNEVGFGKGKIDWVLQRLKRIRNGDAKKYYQQINYFFCIYKDKMTDLEINQLSLFIDSEHCFLKRVSSLFKLKFYRQTIIQTIMFRILYLIGGY